MIDLQLKNEIISLLSPYHPNRVGVFGSYARGENDEDSDLDLLINFKEKISLLKLVQIQHELSDQLQVEVDLITENSLKNPRLKEYILEDLITIFNEEEQPNIS